LGVLDNIGIRLLEKVRLRAPKVRAGSMSDFSTWASATFQQARIDVDDEELALVELIYSGAIVQLEVLDRIDLEVFTTQSIDPRRAPDSP
jgi:hypothetical protein